MSLSVFGCLLLLSFNAETAEELRRARLQRLGKAPAGGEAAAAPAPAAAAAAAAASLPSAAPSSAGGSAGGATASALADPALRPEPLAVPAVASAAAAADASPAAASSSSLSSSSAAAAAGAAPSTGFVPSAELLSQLVAFDFDRGMACRALEATGNASIAAAVDWMMMNEFSVASAAPQPQLLASPSSAASASSPTGSAGAAAAAAVAAGPVDAAAGAAARRAIEAMAAEDRAAARLCAETIVTLCGNVLKDPGNPRFQQVNLANEKIRERLVRVGGGVEAMVAGGWARDDAANQLRMPDAAAAAPCLRAVVQELQAALAAGGRLSL